jgi:hypothetical protein
MKHYSHAKTVRHVDTCVRAWVRGDSRRKIASQWHCGHRVVGRARSDKLEVHAAKKKRCVRVTCTQRCPYRHESLRLVLELAQRIPSVENLFNVIPHHHHHLHEQTDATVVGRCDGMQRECVWEGGRPIATMAARFTVLPSHRAVCTGARTCQF